MRSFKPSEGHNVSKLRTLWGRFPMNGGASPAAWTQGGRGMGVPTRTGAGAFSVVLTDAPGGVLVGWDLNCRADAIGNEMNIYGGTWNSATNTFTFTTATLAAPTVAADPPAAAADREFCIQLYFSQNENL